MRLAGSTLLQRRIWIGAAFCVGAYALVGLKLAGVTLFAAPALADRPASVAGYGRADLVDRNGELLARDVRVYDLYALPPAFVARNTPEAERPAARLKAERASAAKLAPILGIEASYLLRKFSGRTKYVLLARQLTPAQRDGVQALRIAGLQFEDASKRNYPVGRMAAQVLGVTNVEGHGISGLERGLDARLRSGAAGARVETSLDMRVQFVLAHETAAGMDKFKAQAAGALVMDVRTGEILGLVSLPDFDPNDRTGLSGDETSVPGETDGRKDSTRNIMAQDVYELGSVFKLFSFALGLEDGTFRPDEVFPIGRAFRIDEKYVIHEAESMPPRLAARDVLARSSNIGTAQIALRSGGERQRQFLTRMGLLKSPRTELPESARPLYPRYWGRTETATVAYGHGISVSPLAFAAAAAAVVNGGRRVAPTFLKQSADIRGEALIRPETSAEMRTLMRYVVTNGTGARADAAGYDVGGKTGSAEKIGRRGVYEPGKLVTSFCAVFPIASPRYLVFVMLDEPHAVHGSGNALAGFTAAPVAGQIVARIAPLLNVPMTQTVQASAAPKQEVK